MREQAIYSFSEELKRLKLESKNINKRARVNYLEQVSDISEKLKHYGSEASTKAKEVIDNVGEYIKENPQKATLFGLGVGLGLGVVIGMLIKRK